MINDYRVLPLGGGPWRQTGVCGQGMFNVFAAPPIKYFKILFRLSIPNPNLKP